MRVPERAQRAEGAHRLGVEAPGATPPRSTFRLNEPGSPEVTVRPDLLRGPRVLVDGAPVERHRDGVRIYWPIRMADGTERRLFLIGQLTGLRAIVDDVVYPIERPLSRRELVLAVAPIAVVPVLVGAVGLLTGGAATSLAFGVFRTSWSPAMRLVAWAGTLLLAVVLGFVTQPLLAAPA